MAPPLKIISIVWRIIEPSMIFLSEKEQSMQYFTPIVKLLQKIIGYWLTFIQTSDLYFLSIHTIVLELDHQYVHM